MEKTVYEIKENMYIITWYNFLHIKEDISTNSGYEYLRLREGETEKDDVFPNNLLNIDVKKEIVWCDKDGKIYFFKFGSFDTTDAMRCQKATLKTFEVINDDTKHFDLIFRECDYVNPDFTKYMSFIKRLDGSETCNEIKDDFHDFKNDLKIVNFMDAVPPTPNNILNTMFTKKWNKNEYLCNEDGNNIIGVKFLSVDNVKKETVTEFTEIKGKKNCKFVMSDVDEKLKIEWDDKVFFYKRIEFTMCCGTGKYSYIKMNNDVDADNFDWKKFELDDVDETYAEQFLYLMKKNTDEDSSDDEKDTYYKKFNVYRPESDNESESEKEEDDVKDEKEQTVIIINSKMRRKMKRNHETYEEKN